MRVGALVIAGFLVLGSAAGACRSDGLPPPRQRTCFDDNVQLRQALVANVCTYIFECRDPDDDVVWRLYNRDIENNSWSSPADCRESTRPSAYLTNLFSRDGEYDLCDDAWACVEALARPECSSWAEQSCDPEFYELEKRVLSHYPEECYWLLAEHWVSPHCDPP